MYNPELITCVKCGALIRFVKLRSGKKMPCNAELLPFWRLPGSKDLIVTQGGRVLKACVGEEWRSLGEPDGYGYISHFATCPAADSLRKQKQENQQEAARGR